MEQTTENAQNSNSGSNSGAECDPWKYWKDDGTLEGFDCGGMFRMGKSGRYFNGTYDNCHQHGHAWRYCPKMSEQDKIAFAAKKGVNYKGGSKGGGEDQGGKRSGKGWDCGKGFGKKGLNEMGGNGWDLGD